MTEIFLIGHYWREYESIKTKFAVEGEDEFIVTIQGTSYHFSLADFKHVFEELTKKAT